MIIMLGTDRSGQGGIASVVNGYHAAGLFDDRKIVFLATHRTTGRLQQCTIFVYSLLSLLRYLLTGQVQIVHAHVASYGSFWRKSVLLWLARQFGASTIYHLHGGGFEHFFTESRFNWIRRWIRATLERSDRVIVLSSNWMEIVLQYAPRARCHVVRNGIEPPSEVNKLPQQPIILFLGKLVEYKGVFDLLEAVSIAREALPHIQLRIGGEGNVAALQAAVQKLGIEQNVQWLGWVTGTDKTRELKGARIFCLPAYKEGLPMALLEAMSFEKCIISTPVGAIPELIQTTVNGVLVTPGDLTALSNAIIELSRNDQLAQDLASEAKKTIDAQFTLTGVLKNLRELYAALIAIKM
jgi:glycosyltransferase involved in cell wall biosynthesis